MWEIEIFYGCWMSRAFLHAGVMKTVAWENIILHILYFSGLPPRVLGRSPPALSRGPLGCARDPDPAELLPAQCSTSPPSILRHFTSPTVLLAC